MPSKSASRSKSKTYTVLKQPTLLKNKPLSKQGKQMRTSRPPAELAAKYAMALYSKLYKQVASIFLYRKGTVSRYSITFKTKSGKKCANAKLTSRSVCKVTPGIPGKSRSCQPYGSRAKKALIAKSKDLSKSKSKLSKARKSLSSVKKNVTKAKIAVCKAKSGSSKEKCAKKNLKKMSKELTRARNGVDKLKAAVKKKTKSLSRAKKSLSKS